MFPLSATMYLAPTPIQQFFDNNGAPLVGGLLFLYAAGSTTKQAGFTDASGATQLPNPIILNERGEVSASSVGSSCGLWLDPTLAYKFVLAPPGAGDPPTSTVWPAVDNIVSANAAVLAALAAYEATVAGIPIGGIIPYGGVTAPTGWVLCYGQQLSRTTYAALFAVIGIAYGPGDSSTTFNTPDLRGRVTVGKDNMGGSAANRVTNAVAGFSGTTLGAAGGDQHAQPDTLTATSTAVSGVSDPGHIHTFGPSNLTDVEVFGGGGPTSLVGGNLINGYTMNPAFTNVAVSTTVTTTVAGVLTGASQNVQPSQITNFIMFAAV